MTGLGAVIGIGVLVLNAFAIYKIITKAGYSGAWMFMVVAPFVAELIGFVVLIGDIRSRNFHSGSFIGWYVLAAVLVFADWILFLIFAFSEWPVLRGGRPMSGPGVGFSPGRGPTGPAPWSPPDSPPPAVNPSGWTRPQGAARLHTRSSGGWEAPWSPPAAPSSVGGETPPAAAEEP